MILKNSKCIRRWVSRTKINGLVLSVYILSNTKHIRKLCLHNVQLNITAGDTQACAIDIDIYIC